MNIVLLCKPVKAFTITVVSSVSLFAACASVSLADDGEIQTIQGLFSESYTNAVNGGDAEGYATLFTTDAVRIPPNRPPESTRAGIKSGIEKVFKKFDFEVEVVTEEVKLEGGFGWVSGIAQGRRKDTKTGKYKPLNTRYISMMRKTESGWKIFRQMWYPIL